MILFQTSNLFTGLGLGGALIHTDVDKRKAAFHSFVMMMAFAFVLFGFVFVYIEPLARLLTGQDDISHLLNIMRWLSLLIIINTGSTIPTAILRKQMMFGRVSSFNLIQQLSYTFIALVLAIMGYGVWSLVIARLTSGMIKLLAAWLMCPGWDWLIPVKWDNELAKGLLSFGIPNMWSGMLNYFHTHWDDLLVGRTLGEATLGAYSKAYDLTNNTVKQVSQNVIGTVFFPSYTKIRDDIKRLTRMYLKSMQVVSLAVIPMAFGVMAIAPELVPVLWGGKWAEMIPLLQIYAFMLISRPISTNTSPLFLALGKPGYNARAGYVLLGVMVPLAFLFLRFGAMGVATAVVISHFVGVIYNVYQANTLLPGSARQTVNIIASPLLIGAIMYGALIIAKPQILAFWGVDYGYQGLISLIAFGGIIYLLPTLVLQRTLVLEIWGMLRPVLARFVPFLRTLPEKQAV